MKKTAVLLLLLVLLLSLCVSASAANLNTYFTATFSASPKFYTGPGTNYLRANNGKAQYGGGGQARVYGYEGSWLLVGYQTGSGNYRIGYFQDSYLAKMKAKDGYDLRPLYFEYRSGWVNTDVDITDDPIIKNEPFGSLASGQACTYLASYDDRWAYIEVTMSDSNRKARGFVPLSAVSFSYWSPTAAPVNPNPPSGGNAGFYTAGVWATASTQMETYSGPGAYYTPTGSYFMQNQAIYCLAKHYDSSSRGWWVLCRMFDGVGAQYVWVSANSFYNTTWLLNQLAQD